MTKHITGTRREWLAARLELLEAEKEHTRHGDELARRRQELPWVRIDKTYRFDTDEGSASLADLFRGRSQLMVYRRRMVWSFPWASSFGNDFNYDFGVAFTNKQQQSGTVEWLDRAPKGRNENVVRGMGDLRGSDWLRRHDEYDNANGGAAP